MKRIAGLTSGVGAPGMNAVIRAVVRTGLAQGWEVFGVKHGFSGLLTGKLVPLGARDVGGIMQRAANPALTLCTFSHRFKVLANACLLMSNALLEAVRPRD